MHSVFLKWHAWAIFWIRNVDNSFNRGQLHYLICPLDEEDHQDLCVQDRQLWQCHHTHRHQGGGVLLC
jgi:hypothetical protein